MTISSFLILGLAAGCSQPAVTGPDSQTQEGNGVKSHGALRVDGASLCDENGNPVVLRGMSSHGISWYPRYLNGGAMKTLKEYGANLFRIAAYTEPSGAYLENPDRTLDYLYMGAESALAEDLYVILDWHILNDSDPNEHIEEAKDFFDQLSAHYADEPGILYEICNEPNGDVTWEQISAYAEEVIPVIRKNTPDAVILVGTPNYCSHLDGPLSDPLPFENIMYSYHRYVDISVEEAGWAGPFQKYTEQGLPVFVTEWGVSAGEQAYFEDEEESQPADAELYPETAEPFLDAMDRYQISWAGWALCNKAEWHSAIRPDCTKYSGWDEDDLTVSGKLMFSRFLPEVDGQ